MLIKNLLSRKFHACDKTYQEEIEYLNSQSINIFKFVKAEETSDMHNARIKKQEERLKLRLLYFGGGILIALLCGL